MTSSGVGLLNYWYHYCIATELLALLLQVEVPRDSASNDSFSNDSFSATPNIFQVCFFTRTISFLVIGPPPAVLVAVMSFVCVCVCVLNSLTALSRCYILRRRGRVSSTLMSVVP